MRFPQVVVCGFDDWTANQLRQLTADHRWLLRELRQARAVRDLLLESRPTVLVLQIDPGAKDLERLKLISDIHQCHPDVAMVVLSDTKLSEEERAMWSASVMDLGARFVVFPPLSRPVLEDLIGGLMTAVLRRTGNALQAPQSRPEEAAIDLAESGYEDE